MSEGPQAPGVLVALATLALLTLAGQLATAAVPEVIAELKIDSTRVADALGDRRASVEAQVAGLLTAEAERHFPYVRWITPDEASDAATPRLILRLIEGPVTCAPGIRLVLAAELQGEEDWQSEELRLYRGCDPDPPFSHPDDQPLFEADLQHVLQAAGSDTQRLACDDCHGWFFRDKLRQEVQQQFLGKVSLIDRLQLEEPRVLLPLPMAELKAAADSRLLVEFWVRSEQPEGVRSELWLSPWDGMGDAIHCRLTKLTAPAAAISETWTEDHFWHDSLPALLADANLVRLRVLMMHHVLDSFAGVASTAGAVTSGP